MIKKIIIATAAIIIVAAVGLVAYIYFSPAASSTAAPPTKTSLVDTLKSFFPSSASKSDQTANNPEADVIVATGTPTADQNQTNQTVSLPAAGSLRELTTTRVAGLALLPVSPSTSTLYFIQREDGRLFTLSSTTGQIERLTQTTISRVVRAMLGRDKVSLRALLQTDDNGQSKNLVATLKVASTSDTGGNLDWKNISNTSQTFAVSPSFDQIFYLDNFGNQTIGTVSDWDLKKKLTVFQNPFGSWLAAWPETSTIVLLTKPSAQAAGYLYFVNPKSNQTKQVLAGVPGLTALVSPDAKKILYSTTGPGEAPSLNIYDLTKASLVNLGLKTLPDKCVWSRSGNQIYCAVPVAMPRADYPDAWYQGEVTFQDNLWAINPTTGENKLIMEPSKILTGLSLDATNLIFDAKNNLLYFINRLDETIWVANLGASF